VGCGGAPSTSFDLGGLPGGNDLAGCWLAGGDVGSCVTVACGPDLDCPTGQVCCGHVDSTQVGQKVILTGAIRCEPTADCSPSTGDYQLCGTPSTAPCLYMSCHPTVGGMPYRCR
jgi:hypothetical protein